MDPKRCPVCKMGFRPGSHTQRTCLATHCREVDAIRRGRVFFPYDRVKKKVSNDGWYGSNPEKKAKYDRDHAERKRETARLRAKKADRKLEQAEVDNAALRGALKEVKKIKRDFKASQDKGD